MVMKRGKTSARPRLVRVCNGAADGWGWVEVGAYCRWCVSERLEEISLSQMVEDLLSQRSHPAIDPTIQSSGRRCVVPASSDSLLIEMQVPRTCGWV